MNVVLYLRYSSARQTEQSIEGQDRVCTAYCEREGHTIIHRYIDRGTSASKDIEKRTDFLAMIEDALKGEFSAVVVYSLDRFARDRFDSAIYRKALKKCGVSILSATEHISDSPEGILMESLLEGLAEYYSKELRQKVIRGMKESAMKGRFCGGTIPFGYDIVDSRFVINEKEASAVRYIFEHYANREHISEIRDGLNLMGYTKKNGDPLELRSFQTILHNRKYIGEYRCGDYVNYDAVPPIVSKELFDKVQEIIPQNKSNRGKPSPYTPYMVSGKLYCECGEKMTGCSARNKYGKLYQYYLCRNAYIHKCDQPRIPREIIDDNVIRMIQKMFDEDFISAIAEGIVTESEKSIKTKAFIELQEKLKDLHFRRKNLENLLEQGKAVDFALTRLEEIKAEIIATEDAINQAKKKPLTKEEVVAWLNRFTQGQEGSIQYCKFIIRKFCKRITVRKDGRVIVELEHPDKEDITDDKIMVNGTVAHHCVFALIF